MHFLCTNETNALLRDAKRVVLRTVGVICTHRTRLANKGNSVQRSDYIHIYSNILQAHVTTNEATIWTVQSIANQC